MKKERLEEVIEEIEVKDENEKNIFEDILNDDEYIFEDNKKLKRAKLIINIVFSIILVLILMVAVDLIGVTRFNVGPFFSIPTKTYKDGGTKEYLGLGYKVIKYNQLQGRRDRELGSWSLKYDIEPITAEAVDLALAFAENANTYSKYDKEFVRIVGTLKKVDTKNNKITMGYTDEGGKYTLDIVCDVVADQTNLDTFEKGKEITIIGKVVNFKAKTNKKPNTLYVENVFAEQ